VNIISVPYLGLDTMPAQVIRLEKEEFAASETKLLDTGQNNLYILIQDEDYIYIGLDTEPAQLVRLAKDDFKTTMEKVFEPGENNCHSLAQNEEFIYLGLDTEPAKVMRVSKVDWSTTTKTLPRDENNAEALLRDGNFLYVGLDTDPAQIVRILDFEMIPVAEKADSFQRYDFDLASLSTEQKKRNRYDKIVFAPYQQTNNLTFYLDNVNYGE
jgi:hypothetical protein